MRRRSARRRAIIGEALVEVATRARKAALARLAGETVVEAAVIGRDRRFPARTGP
jgi:hypothetical protein